VSDGLASDAVDRLLMNMGGAATNSYEETLYCVTRFRIWKATNHLVPDSDEIITVVGK
jgi:hypothetical protein